MSYLFWLYPCSLTSCKNNLQGECTTVEKSATLGAVSIDAWVGNQLQQRAVLDGA